MPDAKQINLKNSIRTIPDFPKKGIMFRDITTLLSDKDAFKKSIDLLVEKYANEKIDHIVAVEARGFILGGALAYKLNTGFVPVRKKGKLPYKTQSYTYDLEYGTDTLEIHEDAIKPDENILIVDDLLATGGTVEATANLVKKFNAHIIGICFLIELPDLKGREKLKNYPIYSLIEFEGE